MPVEVICCYAPKDKAHLRELRDHLIILERQELITIWADLDISAGKNLEKEIEAHLNSADIILLLVSSYFLSSEHGWNIEMSKALERHKAGEALVIPIILRPCMWDMTPFARLQVLPEDGRPVTNWRDRHEPLNNIAWEIGQIAIELLMEKKGIGAKKKSDSRDITKRSDKIRSGKVVEEPLPDDPRKIIVEVLSIIGYEDDKEAYAAEFIDLTEKQALLVCLQELPPDKQEAFKKQMSQATEEEHVKEVIKQYVSAEEYTEALKSASQDAFTKFIETLIPELDDEQRDQLQKYLHTVYSIGVAKHPGYDATVEASSNVREEAMALQAPIVPTLSAPTEPLTGETPLAFSGLPLGKGFIYVTKGKEQGRVYKIDKTVMTIGREEKNDIILDDTKISRFHASLICQSNGSFMLKDEKSSNGTVLNGNRMIANQLYPLRQGDKIQLGKTQLVFSIGTEGNMKSLNNTQPKSYLFDEKAVKSFQDFLQDFKKQGQGQTTISYHPYANRILAEADARDVNSDLLIARESDIGLHQQISLTPQRFVKIIQAKIDKDLEQVRSKASFIRVATRFLLNFILAETSAGKIGSSHDDQDEDAEKAFLRSWFPLASILLKENLSAPDQYWDSVLSVLKEHHLEAAYHFLEERATELYVEGEWLSVPTFESCKASLHRVYCPSCKSGSWMDFWNIIHSSDIQLSLALREGSLNRYVCAFCGYFPTLLRGIWHIPDYLGYYFMYRVASFHDPHSASIYKMPDSLAKWQDEETLLSVLRLLCKDMGSIADSDFQSQNTGNYSDNVLLVFSDEEFQEKVSHILKKKHKRHDPYLMGGA